MGILSRLVKSVTDDLDRRVSGSDGVAQGEHRLRRGHVLQVSAAIAPPHSGEIVIGPQRGRDRLTVELGPTETLEDSTVTIATTVSRAGGAEVGALAGLTAELSQRDPARPAEAPAALDTFSVESRFTAEGTARLFIEVRLPGGGS